MLYNEKLEIFISFLVPPALEPAETPSTKLKPPFCVLCGAAPVGTNMGVKHANNTNSVLLFFIFQDMEASGGEFKSKDGRDLSDRQVSASVFFFFLIKKFVVILHTDCVDVLRVAEEREVLCFAKIGLPHCWMGVMLLSAVLNTEPRLRFTWSSGSGLPQALCVTVW